MCGVALTGGLACVETPEPGALHASAGLNACPATPGQVMVTLVNAERRQRGLPPLAPDQRLWSAVRAQIQDVVLTGTLAHEGRDGSTPADRVTAAVLLWTSVGENLAADQVSPAETLATWMRSEPHRRNLLQPQFTSARVAMVEDTTSLSTPYWAMVFAAGLEMPAPGSEPCHP